MLTNSMYMYIIPCIAGPGVLFTNVTLSPPVVEENFVNFYCDFDYVGKTPSADNGARFEVSFYFDQVRLPEATMVVSAPVRRINMQEKWLRGNLGKSVSEIRWRLS